MTANPLGWLAIVRLGLVQTALGAIVVLTTSTMNRVMAVELALPAMLPGLLVAIHYGIQLSRPRWGFASDVGGRRTPWIIGGMAVLATGGILAALSIVLMESHTAAGIVLAVLAFALIGLGVGAAGTSLLALLAKSVAPERRAAAATVVWVMMIVGFIVTAAMTGALLDPYSSARLLVITTVVAVLAWTVATMAVWGVESSTATAPLSQRAGAAPPQPRFAVAFGQIWREARARQFTIFIFVSMFAYSAQDLILEPFAGNIFGYTPGQSTKLAGLQHGGVLAGMIAVALIASLFARTRFEPVKFLGSLGFWTVAGCLASAAALLSLALGGFAAAAWPLQLTVFALGFANGSFAVAAIGSMMALAAEGREGREGTRMGLWGAAQAIAFGLGGFLGAAGADVVRLLSGSALFGYAAVFAIEAVMFFAAAIVAAQVWQTNAGSRTSPASFGIARPRLSDIGRDFLSPGAPVSQAGER